MAAGGEVVGLVEVVGEVEGIDDGDHGVEAGEVAEGETVGVGEGEGFCDWERFADACGFDEEVVEAIFSGEVADFDEEVFAESAADAAVGEFDEFFVGAAESGVA